MIIYRERRRTQVTRTLFRDLTSQLDELHVLSTPGVDALSRALIDAGELASAVSDAVALECDTLHPSTQSLVELVVELAAAFDAAWHDAPERAARSVARARAVAARCHPAQWPAHVAIGISEGFAFYGTGPELYAAAARTWAHTVRPQSVCCLGLRTVGLTLAATVAVALRREGIETCVVSVRPRGHPFDRHIRMDAASARSLAGIAGAWFLVVDEGPGLSGSSMAGTARWLTELGVPDDRIVLMPDHLPSRGALAEQTRRQWMRHLVHPADFDETWVASGRLASRFAAASLIDVGAGRWRNRVRVAGRTPAVHPAHERRKYLIERDGERTLLKFAGYGRYGQQLAARADAAADAGWSPPRMSLRMGWLELPWIDGAFGLDSVTADEVRQLAQYLAFIRRSREAHEKADDTALLEMAVANAREALGDAAAGAMERLSACRGDAAPVVVDGRVQRHEWCKSAGRLQKLDGLDHGDDHFFPGPCDIAWDVAGAIEEWPLTAAASRMLVEEFARASGDSGIAARLPFYRAAYLAFRAGYAAFCAEAAVPHRDARQFERDYSRYRTQLAVSLGIGERPGSRR